MHLLSNNVPGHESLVPLYHPDKPPKFETAILTTTEQGLFGLCREWGVGAEGFNILLRCMKRGVVFTHYVDDVFSGLSALEITGLYTAYLHMLPKTYGREFLESVKKWARGTDLKELQVSSTNMNGSGFRYFEKTLGFHRSAVIFTLTL